MITFNPDIVDRFVGRAVSGFTTADLPPLNAEFPNVDKPHPAPKLDEV
jgi:hypothetical protein